MKRLKVLISAYACEPNKGSEPGVGWNLAREMAKYYDIWVITRANNQPIIEAELEENPVPNLKFVYYDLPRWGRWWKRGKRGVQLYYYFWQIAISFVAKRLHQEIKFDLAHHVTFVKYSTPSLLSALPIPFIFGPVGGGESAPKAFWQDFSVEGKLYEVGRSVARWLGEHDPLVRGAAKRSALCLATTSETKACLHKLGAKRVELLGESGLGTEDIQALASFSKPHEQMVRFVSIGRLLHWKGFHLGIRAFAEAGLESAEYWIIGSGPEMENFGFLAHQLGVADKVHFLGELKRQEVLTTLAKCHVLVHPSLHDSGGWVCLEAMAAGVPVVCLDLGGPALQVTDKTGIKVAAIDTEQAVQDLALAMRRLAGNESLRSCMGMAGRTHVTQNYSWEQKGFLLHKIYMEVSDAGQ